MHFKFYLAELISKPQLYKSTVLRLLASLERIIVPALHALVTAAGENAAFHVLLGCGAHAQNAGAAQTMRRLLHQSPVSENISNASLHGL